MHRPPGRFLMSALALVLGALTLGPMVGLAPASAESVSIDDGSGDVWFYGEGPEGPAWQQVPSRTRDDVSSVTVDLRAHRLVLTTSMAEVPPAGETPGAGPVHMVKRSRGEALRVYADITGNQSSVAVLTGDRVVKRCSGDDARVVADRDAGTVVVTLTDHCLRAQRWVRVSTLEQSPSGRHVYVDAVGNDGHDAGAWTPRVRVG